MKPLEQRVHQLELWRDGHDLKAMSETLTKLKITIDGDDTITNPGLVPIVTELTTAVGELSELRKQLETQLRAVYWTLAVLVVVGIVAVALASKNIGEGLRFLADLFF